ncbi:SbtA family thio(seleno)oxazole RiPP natural product precursor [Desulfonatronum parangueonense]
MENQDVKTYLAGLCLAALLTGGTMAAPGPAFGSGSGCSTNGAKAETSGNGTGSAGDEPVDEPSGDEPTGDEPIDEPTGSGA